MIKRIFEILKQDGIGLLVKRIFIKIRKLLIRKISFVKQNFFYKRNFEYINMIFANKSGLEIGGPSNIFRDERFLPLYQIVKELDGCNFSNNTIWEGNIDFLKKYDYYNNKKGVQYISEATNLSFLPDGKYDFVISSNCLEHIANPLKAIGEWIRVIKNGGSLLLILPNKKYCFDHNRQVTSFSHLMIDLKTNIKEDDLTHIYEILELHDLEMDESAGSFEQFRERSFLNFQNRALHQHIFNIVVLKEIFSYFKLEVLLTYEDKEFIILGKKI